MAGVPIDERLLIEVLWLLLVFHVVGCDKLGDGSGAIATKRKQHSVSWSLLDNERFSVSTSSC